MLKKYLSTALSGDCVKCNKKCKDLCPFENSEEHEVTSCLVYKCKDCIKKECISRTEAKKQYTGIDLSTIDYLSVYIREYKTHAVYFNHDQLKAAFAQFIIVSL